MKIKGHLKRLASALAAAVIAVLSLLPMAGRMLEMPETVLTASAATFDDINADEVFLQQGMGTYTCTMYSVMNMLRRAYILDGRSDWNTITEDNVRPQFWGSAGMNNYINFRGLYEVNYYGSNCGTGIFPSDSAGKKKKLISLLDEHPEGIVAYDCYGKRNGNPHAVLLTDYDASTDTFYSVDPYPTVPGVRLPLEKTTRPNYEDFDGCWMITSPKVNGFADEPWITDGRLYKVATNTDPLNMRSSASQSASVITQIPKGTIVTVLQTRNGWGQVRFGTQIGYCMMEWLTLASEEGKSPSPDNPEQNEKANNNDLTKKNVAEGNYNLVNVSDGKYMNFKWGNDTRGPERDVANIVCTMNRDNSVEQVFTLKHVGNGKYLLKSGFSGGGYLNCECPKPSDIKAGVELTGRRAYDDDTQYFYFAEDSKNKGEYVIENGYKPNLVVTASGNSGALTLQSYTGAANQRWKLEKAGKLPEKQYGLDVSSYQGEIDWKRVKSLNPSFAILRNGLTDETHGTFLLDETFETNFKQASSLGIPLGTYYFTGATTVSGIEKEVNYMLSNIKGKKFDLPVYLDFETYAQRQIDLTAIALRGCEMIEAAGFKAGVYASEIVFSDGKIDADQVKKKGYDIWVARYDAHPLDYKCLVECNMLQYAEHGFWDGIAENVDVDIRYTPLSVPATTATPPTTTAKPTTTTTAKTTTTVTTTTIDYPKPVLDRTITEGNYRIQSQNGYHMTVYKQREIDTGHSMVVDMYDGLETQHFALTYHGKGQYTLASGIDPDQNLNNTCAKPENIREGIPVTCWDELENDDRQRFYITPVEYTNDNEVIYVIQSVRHPELVVTPEYQDERLSDLKLQKYDANNKAQEWTFKEPMLATLEVTQTIASGDYKIRNAQLGFIMTKHGEDEPDTDGIWGEMDMSLQSQCYTLKYISEGKYALAVGGESNRFVGCKTSSAGKVKAGDPLYSMELNKDGTQYFWITYVGDDQYILQSALNRKLVIAPKSADSSTFLELQEYDHSLAQRWKLKKAPVAATTTAAPTKSVKTTTTTAKTTAAPAKTTAAPKATTAARTTATAAITTSVAVTTTAASKTTSESITLTNGEQYTINKKNMTFKSNNPDVAVISPSGVITAVGTGGAIISMIDADSNVTQIRITVKAVGEAPAENIGDLNGDNEIGVDDAQITLKAYTERIAGKKTGLTDAQMKAADVDGNGEVSVEDAQLILKYYTEKVVAGKDITWKNILGK